ncbi:MAG: class I SAM-dependent methyltransferase [Candidatus Helarchaeota archaeon]
MKIFKNYYLDLARIFKDKKKVLDIGCGSGPFLDACKSLNITSLGIDISPEKIKLCKEKGLNVELKSALELDYQKGDFDGVICSHIVEHLYPREFHKLIRDIYNILPSTGIIVIITPNPKNPYIMRDSFWNDWTHVRPYSVDAVADLLKKEQFTIIKKGILPKRKLNIIKKLIFKFLYGRNYGDVFVIAIKE